MGREGIGITVAHKALKKNIMFSNQQIPSPIYELNWSNDRSSNSKPLSATNKLPGEFFYLINWYYSGFDIFELSSFELFLSVHKGDNSCL